MQAKYLIKKQKIGGGAFSADLHQVEVLPVEYTSLSYYNERLTKISKHEVSYFYYVQFFLFLP